MGEPCKTGGLAAADAGIGRFGGVWNVDPFFCTLPVKTPVSTTWIAALSFFLALKM